ncbi:hypothetical protein M878_42495 [Streptomyces roseochromogenus subsp. oscitans DS 12.976]|uniref:Uncharacterized protein n=1 Tax=Streptomyces roseochromogenus subsp. oscitans DS 12.976 TaxID=1352936 RepID=V6JJD6_STRRC|nr:hypothetical protein M878_42495 [Streptomyces roseochromogenus subsp. oscitans DS 12.976]
MAFAGEFGRDAARDEEVQDQRGKRSALETETGRCVLDSALGEVQAHGGAVAEGGRDPGTVRAGRPWLTRLRRNSEFNSSATSAATPSSRKRAATGPAFRRFGQRQGDPPGSARTPHL